MLPAVSADDRSAENGSATARPVDADDTAAAVAEVGDDGLNGRYANDAPIYLQSGWPSVLPLPHRQKWPPPSKPQKYTGYDAQIPTAEQVGIWCRDRADGNPALYLDDGLLAVDIDNYAKGGRPEGRALEVIAEVEERVGQELPETWSLRNRGDGSEKRMYRVPKGLAWRSSLGPGVELIHPTHRYVNVGFNPDTGERERWFDPNGHGPTSMPPSPHELTELPAPFVADFVRTDSDGAVPGLATAAEGEAVVASLLAGQMSTVIEGVFNRARADLNAVAGSRHDMTRWHVETLVRYGDLGLPGAPVALAALRPLFIEAVWRDPERGSRAVAGAEFDRIVRRAGRIVAAEKLSEDERALSLLALRSFEPGGFWYEFGKQAADAVRRIFKVLGPTDWAASVADPEFLIAGVLCRDTFGVNAGPKKSLKTHDNHAIAFSVATGKNLYMDARFPVRRTSRVLYIVGEGGEVPVRRTLRRMARAYGLDPAEIAEDPAFPLVVAFGAASLNSPLLRDELCALLDTHQPGLVLIESFYNFHPAEVSAGNLYERGQVIDAYHRMVRDECAGATSLMTDHYRSTARSKNLDLDNISMSGQAENADSWIIRDHRKDPNVPDGDFWLRVGFNSRQWGGTEWNIDWHLGEFDHEVGHHVGDISWDVEADNAVGGSGRPPVESDTPEGRQRLIVEYVRRNPETSKTAACEVLAKRHAMRDKPFRIDWEELVSRRLLVQGEGQVQRKYGDGMRLVRAKIWQPGEPKPVGSEGSDHE